MARSSWHDFRKSDYNEFNLEIQSGNRISSVKQARKLAIGQAVPSVTRGFVITR